MMSAPQQVSRREARRAAVFMLFQWDVTGRPLGTLFEGEPDAYAQRLAEAVELRAAELDRHSAPLGALGNGAREEVDAVTKAVLAKLLHEPSMVLKETAGTPRGERLVEALRALFDL